ncbi:MULTISPECIES: hypothetical protein [Pseudomonas]|uniref:Uncharacterized protein n=2 Tax=Pseudomonas TaxID=286 RepID=A0A9X4C7Q1_9PSED|nr:MULTISPECIES: hypothetical protein [Pseudomonas]MDD1011984.1 hypothetical protein [Pseudomonas shahriarae]
MKQNRGIIIFFSAMTLLFILVQVWHAKTAPEEKMQERERQLKGLALIMSVQSGKISDESTRIDTVTYSDEVMRISYTLTKVSKDEIDTDEFTKDTKALAASAFCNEKGLGQFVKTGLSINLLYQDSTGSPIVEFQIGKSDCL